VSIAYAEILYKPLKQRKEGERGRGEEKEEEGGK
jgi:hypothetical protein